MSTTLGIATGETDSGAFPSNNDLALCCRSLDDFPALNPGTNGDGCALVVIIFPCLELDILEIVSPDRKSSGTGGPAEKATLSISTVLQSRTWCGNLLMAGVSNHQAYIVVCREVDAINNIINVCNVNCIVHIIAQQTCFRFRSKGIAALICKEGSHYRRGRSVAIN